MAIPLPVKMDVLSRQAAMPLDGKARCHMSATPAPITVLSESDVAALLGLSVKTLRNWRVDGKGPVYAKPGRVVYLHDDVMAYLAATRRAPDGSQVAPIPVPANDPAPASTPVKRRPSRPKGSYTKRVMLPVRSPLEAESNFTRPGRGAMLPVPMPPGSPRRKRRCPDHTRSPARGVVRAGLDKGARHGPAHSIGGIVRHRESGISS